MEDHHKIIALLIGTLFFSIVGFFIGRRSIRPTAILLWIFVASFIFSIPVFEPVYTYLSKKVIGFADSRHIIYVATIGFLLLYNFYLTLKVSDLSDSIKVLIKEVALLGDSDSSKDNED